MPRSSSSFSRLFMYFLLAPIFAAAAFYLLDSFDPALVPFHEPSSSPVKAPAVNDRMLRGSQKVGFGELNAPEEVLYDSESGFVYTGCEDGWIRRVKVSESETEERVVEDVINTGGRPLGIALRNDEIIVANADKLLETGATKHKGNYTTVLTDEAGGRKFKLTDAVDVADDGTIYFTDASYKYNIHYYGLDFLEGRPNGRLLSFDPKSKTTRVLVSNLYFANGVAVSPDQTFVVFCETIMKRCRRYYIKGFVDKIEDFLTGRVENFIDNLSGAPDNIHYDGEGLFWIAIVGEYTKI